MRALVSRWWLVFLVALADWTALKTRVLSHPPWVLAALAGGMLVLLVAHFGLTARDLRGGRYKKVSAWGEMALLSGVLLAIGAGTANWALGLQGFVVLHEGEAVPLHGGSHLEVFEQGPLSSIGEMDMVLLLEEVELVPAGDETFFPISRLRIDRGTEPPVRVAVSRQEGAAAGTLRFYQGAFGFAPRIVILEGEETIFDEVVPFTTERTGASGVVFLGHFMLEKSALELRGSLSLPEGIRGHATLELSVHRNGRLLGQGSLLPGHFADLSDGYRVGFAGLRKWSEIDLSRRSYGEAVLIGGALALAGGVLWPLARWRGW